MFNFVFSKNVTPGLKRRFLELFDNIRHEICEYLDFSNENFDFYVSKKDMSDQDSWINRRNGITATVFPFDNMGYIDILRDDFLENEFYSIIMHELNHMKRGQKYSSDFCVDAIIFEGLAMTFERQIRNEKIYSDTAVYVPDDNDTRSLKNGLAKIFKMWKEDDWEGFDWYEWFYNFDGRNSELGENFAYKIGYWWVREYCKFYNLKPIEAVQVPTDEFVVFAREELLCEK